MLKERMEHDLRSTSGADRKGSELLHYWKVVSEVSVFWLFNIIERRLFKAVYLNKTKNKKNSTNYNIVKYFNLKQK